MKEWSRPIERWSHITQDAVMAIITWLEKIVPWEQEEGLIPIASKKSLKKIIQTVHTIISLKIKVIKISR